MSESKTHLASTPLISAEDSTLALQRDLAERILLAALREHDVADRAQRSSERSAFLVGEMQRIGDSLDEDATLRAIASLSLPERDVWCIVDLVSSDAAMRRLAISHPDPAKQMLVRGLHERWVPRPEDRFGVPAAVLNPRTSLLSDDIDDVLLASTRDADTWAVLRDLGIGQLLTVPLMAEKLLLGAITFVAPKGRQFTEEDVELAQGLAARSARALESARKHRDVVALQEKAESASNAKSEFLGTMSHEMRTPLAAIAGYLDIIDMGLHGPVTDAQHTDLSRMRHSLEHLVRLINDVLIIVRVGRRQLQIDNDDVAVGPVLSAAFELVEPLVIEKHLQLDGIACEPGVVMHADREKVTQILLNLLSNAIKFTPLGGRVTLGCEAQERIILIRVSDSGIGIPADKLDAIFEPFVQVTNDLTRRGSGVGLGLAISRDLARAMNGDLTVESALGKGSRFTLSLPAADRA